jgi:hypothetical protein
VQHFEVTKECGAFMAIRADLPREQAKTRLQPRRQAVYFGLINRTAFHYAELPRHPQEMAESMIGENGETPLPPSSPFSIPNFTAKEKQ